MPSAAKYKGRYVNYQTRYYHDCTRGDKVLRRLRLNPVIKALYRELEIRDLIESETTRMHGFMQSWRLAEPHVNDVAVTVRTTTR